MRDRRSESRAAGVPRRGAGSAQALQARGFRVRRLLLALLCVGTGGLCLAPTPGDIGGCGAARELDPVSFFRIKGNIDCGKCTECGINTVLCARACNRTAGEEDEPSFDARCRPLAHDGAVCLRALSHATCADYRSYMGNTDPTLPSECDFCPPALAPDGGFR